MSNQARVIHDLCSCNKLMDEKTLHPLISIVSPDKQKEQLQFRADCYMMILRQHPSTGECFGRKKCDFSDATLLFRPPGKATDFTPGPADEAAGGRILLFSPELIACTPLGLRIGDFTFFKYKSVEALHLSGCELRIVQQCLDQLQTELQWGVDKFSQTIICTRLELLLNYCRRFYYRQFITRHDEHEPLLQQLQTLVDDYLRDGQKVSVDCFATPCASTLAKRLGLSSAYLNDLLRHETGSDLSTYAQQRRIILAKQLLLGTKMTERQIAENLGFGTAGGFRRLFVRLTGITPTDYRSA